MRFFSYGILFIRDGAGATNRHVPLFVTKSYIPKTFLARFGWAPDDSTMGLSHQARGKGSDSKWGLVSIEEKARPACINRCDTYVELLYETEKKDAAATTDSMQTNISTLSWQRHVSAFRRGLLSRDIT